MEPLYSFTIPSLEDDTPLDCRIYHKTTTTTTFLSHDPAGCPGLRGAILAHPYPPLGGCYDDPVVLSLSETLLAEGRVVVTFNFRCGWNLHGMQWERRLTWLRGAGESAGRTSWTGNDEVLDYCSVVGLVFYYMQHMQSALQESNTRSPITSVDDTGPNTAGTGHPQAWQLLLGGYSFGALILARLPPVSTIVDRFENAERGTAASEIILRARKLATQTLSTTQDVHSPRRGRDMHLSSPHKTHSKASPVTLGGEETDSSDRRRSRDSRRSVDVVREVLPRIKPHRRRRSRSGDQANHGAEKRRPMTGGSSHNPRHSFTTAYLLVSPVLLPLTSTLCPPGLPFPHAEFFTGSKDQPSSGLLSLQSPTFIVFGAADGFTSSKKLQQWVERLCRNGAGRSRWERIDHAGHFWREADVMQRLQGSVAAWVKTVPA